MTQRITFTREKIIDAAFTLTREKGWGYVTARTIARALGSSTMPLYSSLKSMVEIQKAVRDRAERLMNEFQHRTYTDNAMLNAAIGYVSFARSEANLFKALFDNPGTPLSAPLGTDARRPVPNAAEVNGIYRIEDQPAAAIQDPLVLKNWIFVHGLASLIAGKVIELSEESIGSLIQEAAAGFYMHQTYLKGEKK